MKRARTVSPSLQVWKELFYVWKEILQARRNSFTLWNERLLLWKDAFYLWKIGLWGWKDLFHLWKARLPLWETEARLQNAYFLLHLGYRKKNEFFIAKPRLRVFRCSFLVECFIF